MSAVNPKVIFPRLYASLPRTGKTDISLSTDDTPVESSFAGDILILYGVDKGVLYELLSEKSFRELEISKTELHRIAIENLTNTDKEIRFFREGDFAYLKCDGDLEASLILHEGIWDVIRAQIGGDFVVSVPARNTILISGISKREISAIKKKTCECLEMAHRPLSLKLFAQRNGRWEEFVP